MTNDMNLPEGKTCKDCAHWKRCSWLIGELDGTETHCDWAPSRYTEYKYKCDGCGYKTVHPISLNCNCGNKIVQIRETST